MKNTVDILLQMKGSPSPRPSPVGRGGNVPCRLAKPRWSSARQPSEFLKADNGCSLSPGERVRVRGKQTYKFLCSIFFIYALFLSLHAQDSVKTLAGQAL